MIRWLLLVLASCLLCVGPAWAGVVDDAEEVLKQIETDGPGLKQLRAEPTNSRTNPMTSSSSEESTSSSSSARATTRRRSRSGRRAASRTTSQEPAEDSQGTRRMRDSKQRALSFGGLVLLLGLIALAAVLGRKLAAPGGSDD